jgi:hypothetical protein
MVSILMELDKWPQKAIAACHYVVAQAHLS